MRTVSEVFIRDPVGLKRLWLAVVGTALLVPLVVEGLDAPQAAPGSGRSGRIVGELRPYAFGRAGAVPNPLVGLGKPTEKRFSVHWLFNFQERPSGPRPSVHFAPQRLGRPFALEGTHLEGPTQLERPRRIADLVAADLVVEVAADRQARIR